MLRALARRYCRDGSDAEDLVQDTFLRALRGWHDYDDRGTLRGWLITILKHLSLDRRRRVRRAPRLDNIDDCEIAVLEPPDPPLWATMPIERVHESLAQIPAVLRVTFELHVQGRSYDEIARELQIPKNTVGTRLIRTRQRIRQLLGRSAAIGVSAGRECARPEGFAQS